MSNTLSNAISTEKPTKCLVCNTTFIKVRKHTLFCDRCNKTPAIYDSEIDDETLLEIELLKNPSGKTKAKIENEGFA